MPKDEREADEQDVAKEPSFDPLAFAAMLSKPPLTNWNFAAEITTGEENTAVSMESIPQPEAPVQSETVEEPVRTASEADMRLLSKLAAGAGNVDPLTALRLRAGSELKREQDRNAASSAALFQVRNGHIPQITPAEIAAPVAEPAEKGKSDPAVAQPQQTQVPQKPLSHVGDRALSLDLVQAGTETPAKPAVPSSVEFPGQRDDRQEVSPVRSEAGGQMEEGGENKSSEHPAAGSFSASPHTSGEPNTVKTEAGREARPVFVQELQDDLPAQGTGEARHISVDVKGEDGSVVQVRFSAGESGHLHLNVHSSDEMLSREVRAGSADLIARLEDQGFDVRPTEASSGEMTGDTNGDGREKYMRPDEDEFFTSGRTRRSMESVFQVQRT